VFLICFVSGALLSLVALGLLYRGITYVPEFYRERLTWSDSQLERAHEKFLERVSHAFAEVKRRKKFEVFITEEELNGWAAVQGPRFWPEDAEVRITNPRIHLQDRSLWIAAEVQTAVWRGVVWVVIEPEVRGPNILALRIREARLGRLPLPTNRLARYIVTGYLAETLGGSRAAGFWETSEGMPVFVVQIEVSSDPASPERIQVENVRVGEGILAVELSIAG
jgi:hypothetical protein